MRLESEINPYESRSILETPDRCSVPKRWRRSVTGTEVAFTSASALGVACALIGLVVGVISATASGGFSGVDPPLLRVVSWLAAMICLIGIFGAVSSPLLMEELVKRSETEDTLGRRREELMRRYRDSQRSFKQDLPN